MKKVLISGGSGLVGQSLTHLLIQEGYEVAWLSRSPQKQSTQSFFWDPYQGQIDEEALQWADAVFHLAGAPVAEKRWTAAYKKEIEESRVIPTQFLAKKLQGYANIKKVIGASAIGIYPSKVSEEVYNIDYSPQPQSYIEQVTYHWEQAYADFKVPVSLVRVGIVLSAQGGALSKMNQIPVANPLGSGKQNFPWIHLQDLVRLFLFALESPEPIIVNGVTEPYTAQAHFAKVNAQYNRQMYVGIAPPLWVMKLVVGEMASMLVNGVKITPEKNLELGFTYQFPKLETALKDLYAS